MKVLCSRAMHSCVSLSAARSAASMRCACISSSLKVPIIAASSRAPSTMRSAWALNRSKNLPSRGIRRPSMRSPRSRMVPRARIVDDFTPVVEMARLDDQWKGHLVAHERAVDRYGELRAVVAIGIVDAHRPEEIVFLSDEEPRFFQRRGSGLGVRPGGPDEEHAMRPVHEVGELACVHALRLRLDDLVAP